MGFLEITAIADHPVSASRSTEKPEEAELWEIVIVKDSPVTSVARCLSSKLCGKGGRPEKISQWIWSLYVFSLMLAAGCVAVFLCYFLGLLALPVDVGRRLLAFGLFLLHTKLVLQKNFILGDV